MPDHICPLDVVRVPLKGAQQRWKPVGNEGVRAVVRPQLVLPVRVQVLAGLLCFPPMLRDILRNWR